MFATVVILLPSPYTGGQVHVSHASSAKILDMSATSLLSTSILAWYTDVRHEVKPITSGYRLALSYNLIHSSPGAPKPSLPDMSTALMHLRHVLRKWRKGVYEIEADRDIIAYLLKHEYSAANLASGAKTLKGEDAHKAANLKSIAEEQGVMVCLANLSYHVLGAADDDFGHHDYGSKRGRYGYDSDDHDEGVPSMAEVIEKTFSINNIVDLEGNELLGAKSALYIEESNVIPDEPFEDVEPDDTDYEGYMGNVSCSLTIVSWTSHNAVQGAGSLQHCLSFSHLSFIT